MSPNLSDLGPRRERKEAPDYLYKKFGLKISESTLATYASRGGGPTIIYAGRDPGYYEKYLDEWAMTKISPPVRSTSELAAIKSKKSAA